MSASSGSPRTEDSDSYHRSSRDRSDRNSSYSRASRSPSRSPSQRSDANKSGGEDLKAFRKEIRTLIAEANDDNVKRERDGVYHTESGWNRDTSLQDYFKAADELRDYSPSNSRPVSAVSMRSRPGSALAASLRRRPSSAAPKARPGSVLSSRSARPGSALSDKSKRQAYFSDAQMASVSTEARGNPQDIMKRIEELWQELRIQKMERNYFRAKWSRKIAFDADVVAEMVDVAEALLGHRTKTLKVLKAIRVREDTLGKFELLNRQTRKAQLDALFVELRVATVNVVEAIVEWREMLSRPYQFTWKGVNYLNKMRNDLHVIANMGFDAAYNFPIRNNPLLLDRNRIGKKLGYSESLSVEAQRKILMRKRQEDADTLVMEEREIAQEIRRERSQLIQAGYLLPTIASGDGGALEVDHRQAQRWVEDDLEDARGDPEADEMWIGGDGDEDHAFFEDDDDGDGDGESDTVHAQRSEMVPPRSGVAFGADDAASTREQAATRIQATFRGHRIRKKLDRVEPMYDHDAFRMWVPLVDARSGKACIKLEYQRATPTAMPRAPDVPEESHVVVKVLEARNLEGKKMDQARFVDLVLKRAAPELESSLRRIDYKISQLYFVEKAVLCVALNLAEIARQHGLVSAIAATQKIDHLAHSTVERFHGRLLSDASYVFDDVEEAVSAALELSGVIERFNSSVAEDGMLPLKGIAVTSGDILYVDGGGVHWGEPIAMALQLAHEAGSDGRLVVDSNVHAIIRDSETFSVSFTRKAFEVDGEVTDVYISSKRRTSARARRTGRMSASRPSDAAAVVRNHCHVYEKEESSYYIVATRLRDAYGTMKDDGVIHYATLVMKLRHVLSPVVDLCRAVRVYWEADVMLAMFDTAESAVVFALECARVIKMYNDHVTNPLFNLDLQGFAVASARRVLRAKSTGHMYGEACDTATLLLSVAHGEVVVTPSVRDAVENEAGVKAITFTERVEDSLPEEDEVLFELGGSLSRYRAKVPSPDLGTFKEIEGPGSPFFTLDVDGTTVHTSDVVEHTFHPSWETSPGFVVPWDAAEAENPMLEIWHTDDLGNGERSLGRVMLPFTSLEEGVPQDVWLRLQGSHCGQVHVQLGMPGQAESDRVRTREGALDVYVHQARGVDVEEGSAPLSVKLTCGKVEKKSTNVGSNLTFDEDFRFPLSGDEDALVVELLDASRPNDSSLGTATLYLSDLTHDEVKDVWLDLHYPNQDDDERPQLSVQVLFLHGTSAFHGNVFASVVEAEDLSSQNSNKVCSPFFKVRLGQEVFTTTVQPNTKDPVYTHQSFVFPVHDDVDHLDVTAYDANVPDSAPRASKSIGQLFMLLEYRGDPPDQYDKESD